ncbi:3877_t:CDS:2, partial [Ambispora gerdemannii]
MQRLHVLKQRIKKSRFTRPKDLILLPFNNSALDLDKRFFEDFSIPQEEKTINPNKSGDSFRIGMRFTRKTMKLYVDFYSTDMPILLLGIIIGPEG